MPPQCENRLDGNYGYVYRFLSFHCASSTVIWGQHTCGSASGKAEGAFRAAGQVNDVERPGGVQMMIGNTLYNQKKYTEAPSAFQHQDAMKDAASRLDFMDKKIQRTVVPGQVS